MPFEEADDNTIENPKDETLRDSTDGNYFMLHLVFMCILGGLLTYCIFNGDVRRISVGYDNCKNICGVTNNIPDEVKVSECEGLNMIRRPYLLIFRPDKRNTYNVSYSTLPIQNLGVSQSLSTDVIRLCLGYCEMYPNYELFKSRCILKKTKEVADKFFGKSGIPNFFLEVAEDLALCWKKILYVEAGCSVLSFVLTIMLKFFTGPIIRFLLQAAVLVCLAFTFYMWFLFAEIKERLDEEEYLPSELELERQRTYLAFAIIGTFTVPFLVYIIIKNRTRVEKVVRLYKEILKAVTSMPFLLLVPLLTCIFVSATIAGWFYATLWIESSGNEKRLRPQYYLFVKDSWNFTTRWFNLFGTFWMIYFILDCQHMIIAGAVAFWYFCRNKNDLGVPIFFAFYNLLRYHLGSVSLGSLITLLVTIPRIIFKLMQKYFKTQEEQFINKCCLGCLRLRENVLNYFTRDAYIEVALYGLPFRPGGRRAFKTLTANDLGIASIKTIDNFVLRFAKLFICTDTVLAGAIILQEYEELLHIWVILILIGIFAYFISTCFFSLYQLVIDTIFLCFCEDCKYCNGLSEPYFMPNELLLFVIDSKKFFFGSSLKKIHRKVQALNLDTSNI